MEDLMFLIRRESSRMGQNRSAPRVGQVTSYDPNRHAVKLTLQPEGVETGWVPIASSHIGNGVGIAVGPHIGDQFVVMFHEDDPDSAIALGRLFSDQDQPPVAQSGEMVFQTKSGIVLKLDKDGKVALTTAGHDVTVNAGGGNVAITAANLNLTGNLHVTGDLVAAGGVFTHNGHDVGSTHEHTGVSPGAGLTGPPQ